MLKSDCDKTVFIEKRDVYNYPTEDYCFSPAIKYPEYPFGEETLSPKPNEVYDMVRACLYAMGLDKNNYGTSGWNPLGGIIKQGDKVLLKPNLVIHTHKKDAALGNECIITHPSIVRAIIDYCVIALKGSGQITVGDAPLQSCDFKTLVEQSGYSKTIEFFNTQKIEINLKDFRLSHSKMVKKMGISLLEKFEETSGDILGYCAVDISKSSMHMENIDRYMNYRVTNYDPNGMKKHHNPDVNEYLIPQTVLDADVVINLPKPKTHRKAGITAAMKNLVGINGHKDWLPHHIRGSISENGDEYDKKSILKQFRTSCIEKSDVWAIKGHSRLALFYGMAARGFYYLSKLFLTDKYFEGSWYGNDTIWRTVCDLNRILIYADKHGKLQILPQRRLLQIADMVISGEGEGPLIPTPKKVGAIAAAFNPAVFDMGVCAIMGMDWKKVHNVRGAFGIKDYPIVDCTPEEITIASNQSRWNKKQASRIAHKDSLAYKPSAGWKDHIESI